MSWVDWLWVTCYSLIPNSFILQLRDTDKLLFFVSTNTNNKQNTEWCQSDPVTLTTVFMQNKIHCHCKRRQKSTCRFRCSSVTGGLLLYLNSQLLTQRCHPVVTSDEGTLRWCDVPFPASSQLVAVRNYGVLLRFLIFMSVEHTKTHHAEYQTWHTLEAKEKWSGSWQLTEGSTAGITVMIYSLFFCSVPYQVFRHMLRNEKLKSRSQERKQHSTQQWVVGREVCIRQQPQTPAVQTSCLICVCTTLKITCL